MSNLTKRIIAAAFGIPVLLLASYYGGYYLMGLTLLLNTIALWEFCSMFEKKEIFTLKIITVAAADVLLISSTLPSLFLNAIFGKDTVIGVGAVLIFLFAVIFITAEIFRKEKRSPLNPAVSVFGLIYITAPFVLMNYLHSPSQMMIILIIFILIWTCDSMAYFGGRLYGKHRLSAISPNKTWEGSITGFVFTVIISVILHLIFPDEFSFTDAVFTGIITGIFSQIGDLFESMIKRYCGVKDSSDIIPGHGGILDRFDSLIFVVPVIFVYYMLK